MAKSKRVNILTVCGVGNREQLDLRMYVEDVLERIWSPLQSASRAGE